MTAITLVFGPWGAISLIVTPFFLINNIARYCMSLGMTAPGAEGPPALTQDATDRLDPFKQDMIDMLNKGEKLETVMTTIAQDAGVKPSDVLLYLRQIVQNQKK
jgi:hypothetical protein